MNILAGFRAQKVNTCSESEHISQGMQSRIKLFLNFILLKNNVVQFSHNLFSCLGL